MPSFGRVAKVNAERCDEWHKLMQPWVISDWSNAMQGEAGEFGNVIKKIRRWETGQPGNQDELPQNLLDKAMMEAADTFLYLDLSVTELHKFSRRYGFSTPRTLEGAIVEKFNAVSVREGFPHKLERD